ncbi:ribbon-helix-helix domain-containing protein [Lactovum odontotermitis]
MAPLAERGRPKGERPPKKVHSIRLDEDDSKFLSEYSKKKNVTMSETVRRGLDFLKKEHKK